MYFGVFAMSLMWSINHNNGVLTAAFLSPNVMAWGLGPLQITTFLTSAVALVLPHPPPPVFEPQRFNSNSLLLDLGHRCWWLSLFCHDVILMMTKHHAILCPHRNMVTTRLILSDVIKSVVTRTKIRLHILCVLCCFASHSWSITFDASACTLNAC